MTTARTTARGWLSLEERTALVTGAGTGSGRGIAQALAERGASIAVDDVASESAHAVVAEIAAAGGTAYALAFDITDYDGVKAGVREAEERLGPIDILVNNVGMLREPNRHIPFAESEPEDWKPWIDVNIYGALHCVRTVLPGMIERGWGRIIQISTPLAARGLPNRESLYGGTKAGIEGILRNVAMEVADAGVTVNTLAIGLMANAVEKADPAIVEATLAKFPIRRWLEPDEVGTAVAYLVSEEAAFVTAQVYHLNGGSYHGR